MFIVVMDVPVVHITMTYIFNMFGASGELHKMNHLTRIRSRCEKRLPVPNRYANRVVRLGKVSVLCNRCLTILSKGKSRGRYKLEGTSTADCEECGRKSG